MPGQGRERQRQPRRRIARSPRPGRARDDRPSPTRARVAQLEQPACQALGQRADTASVALVVQCQDERDESDHERDPPITAAVVSSGFDCPPIARIPTAIR